MFEHIIVAMDTDDTASWAALERGLGVAALLNKPLEILYLLEGGENYSITLERRCRDLAAAAGVPYTLSLEVGKNRDTLLHEAQTPSDLLVFGLEVGQITENGRIFRDLLDDVLRLTDGAVLIEIVGPHTNPLPWDPELSRGNRRPRILVGMNGHQTTQKAFERTLNMADQMMASVTAARVIDEDDRAVHRFPERLIELAERKKVTTRFQQIRAPSAQAGLAELMIDHDLLVISTAAGGNLKKRLLGSNARRIILGARYPVILCRHREHDTN